MKQSLHSIATQTNIRTSDGASVLYICAQKMFEKPPKGLFAGLFPPDPSCSLGPGIKSRAVEMALVVPAPPRSCSHSGAIGLAPTSVRPVQSSRLMRATTSDTYSVECRIRRLTGPVVSVSHTECAGAPHLASSHGVREHTASDSVASKATRGKRQKLRLKHPAAEQKAKRKHVQRSVSKVTPMNDYNWKLTLAKRFITSITAIAAACFSSTDPADSAP
jgi:hypothetical protein